MAQVIEIVIMHIHWRLDWGSGLRNDQKYDLGSEIQSGVPALKFNTQVVQSMPLVVTIEATFRL